MEDDVGEESMEDESETEGVELTAFPSSEAGVGKDGGALIIDKVTMLPHYCVCKEKGGVAGEGTSSRKREGPS